MGNKYHDILICVNARCREEYNNFRDYDIDYDIDYSLDKNLNKKRIVGSVFFFYPKKLTSYRGIDYLMNPSEYILTHWCRHEECKNGEKIKDLYHIVNYVCINMLIMDIEMMKI